MVSSHHRHYRRAGYQTLLNSSREDDKRISTCLVFGLAYCVMALLYTVMNVAVHKENPDIKIRNEMGDHQQHVIPTPLWVRDAIQPKYLHALDNPLYQRLLNSQFHTEESKQQQQQRRRLGSSSALTPQLVLDKTVIGVREDVTLSWTHNELISNEHVLILYCPHDQVNPHQFTEAATMAQVRATSLHHGSGSNDYEWFIPSFAIARQTTCQFKLYDEELQLLSTSPILHSPDSKRTPTALHLALTGQADEMVVSFTTGESGTPVIMYGTLNSSDLSQKAQGTSSTYTNTDMCQEPAIVKEPGKFTSPGMLHTIVLNKLQPNTVYHYKVGLASGQGITWSPVYKFQTAPLVGSMEEFSLVVYGDQGCPSDGWGQGGQWTAGMVSREKHITQVHHFGDLSYARGAAHIWDEWFHMISTFSTHVPLMVGVGNHEYDHTNGGYGKDLSGLNESSHGFMPSWGNFGTDSGGECGVPTAKRFTMPRGDPADNANNGVFWYSFDYANVHFVMISSEHDLSHGSPQYTWLEQDLQSVNRTLTPWLVMESHRPLYQSEQFWDQNLVGLGMRYEFESLLPTYKVDVFLAGHYHSYMRTCDGLYESKCNNGGPLHLIIGSAGAQLDTGTLYEQEWTSRYLNKHWGYGRMTVKNATAMHFEFVQAGAENDTQAGTVLDDVWILRKR